MPKQAISTNAAPAAVGPYSQAIKVGEFLFISGQLPQDHLTGEIIIGDIEAQTRQVIRNIEGILSEVKLSLKDVVKTTVFMKDLRLFPQMNKVYQELFTESPPARSTVEVVRIPKDALIEIESIAFTGK